MTCGCVSLIADVKLTGDEVKVLAKAVEGSDALVDMQLTGQL